jgi:hypothetical protein
MSSIMASFGKKHSADAADDSQVKVISWSSSIDSGIVRAKKEIDIKT